MSAAGAIVGRVQRAAAGGVRRVQEPRPGPGDRRRGDGVRRDHPGPGRRVAARPEGVLAVEVLAEDAEGRDVPAARPVHRAAPGRGRAGLRRHHGRARARRAGDEGRLRRVQPAPGDTESSRAIKDLQAGFPAGALNPTKVYVRSDRRYAARPGRAHDVRREAGEGGRRRRGAPGRCRTAAWRCSTRTRRSPRSTCCSTTRRTRRRRWTWSTAKLRDAAHADAPAGTTALLGGVTASYTDIRDANSRDLSVIFPVAGGLIAVILALLLRACWRRSC